MRFESFEARLFSVIVTGLLASATVLAGPVPAVEVVQSVPLETTLAVPGVRMAQDVWLEMINAARTTIDLEQFYVADQAGEALEPVIKAIETASKRGVKVRLIADKKFLSNYPDSVRRIGKFPGAESRIIDFSASGGVQHAKFFIVDGKSSFVGSQNFDWRALNQIHEIGVKLNDAKVNADLALIFEKDWSASDTQRGLRPEIAAVTPAPAQTDLLVVASPPSANPAGIAESLGAVVALIDAAQRTVKIQVMEFTTSVYGGGKRWTVLTDAIARAAARGVQVQVLVDISNVKKAKTDMKNLARTKNVEVRAVTIPKWSGGNIEYARLIHSKYMVIDDSASWVGSENWSMGYFMNTRDVGVVIRDTAATSQLNQIFTQVWTSRYSAAQSQ